MNPVSHFLISWSVGAAGELDKKGRVAVTVAGVLPDVDGFGIIFEKLTENTSHPLYWWSDYHHTFGHNVFFGLILATGCFLAAGRSLKAAALALVVFHIHLLCDLVGAGGPEHTNWGIPYLFPVIRTELQWSGQWPINAWPNVLITACALAYVLFAAWKKGCSPVEVFSARGDEAVVRAVKARFNSEDANG